MISLCILVLMLVIPLPATAWVVARVARAVGSSRGRFGVGMLAVLCNLALDIAVVVIVGVLPFVLSVRAGPLALVLFIGRIWATFLILKYLFRLSDKRTFAPFGALITMIGLQFVLAIFVIKPFLVESFVIGAGGMSPTIDSGDRLLANKLASPRRWDMVVYRPVDGDPTAYCKRVIALPGERLRFEGGGIFINDQPVNVPPVLAGRCHASAASIPPAQARYHDGETIVLGDDEFFTIGDNVDTSIDSRITGPSPMSSVVGVIDMVYWPWSRLQFLR